MGQKRNYKDLEKIAVYDRNEDPQNHILISNWLVVEGSMASHFSIATIDGAKK